MVHPLVYRTDDVTRWGLGQGSDLAAVTIDLDFWYLFSALDTLESTVAANTTVSIDFISTVGNKLYVHLTNHAVEGPFTIPALFWAPKGNWAPATIYNPLDVVSNDGALYIVNVTHTSAGTFSVFATDGLGHDLYTLLLEQPMNELPLGGTPGQRLAKSTNSPYQTEWVTDFVRLAIFVEGQPLPNEEVAQYNVVDHMFFPAGLVGSIAYSGSITHSAVSWTINKNGAPIGTIDFNGPSPATVNATFSTQVTLVPGDIITVIAPAIPDTVQANISITLVASLTL